jgi:signal peptidase I
VPRPTFAASGTLGDLARLAQDRPVVLATGLFLLFATLTHYWRFHLPGKRQFAGVRNGVDLSSDALRDLAAAKALYEELDTRHARRRIERVLTAEQRATLSARLSELDATIRVGDSGRARLLQAQVESLADSVLAAGRRRASVGFMAAIVAAAALALGMRRSCFESYTILSGSMLPSLEPGDHVIGSKLAYRLRMPGVSRAPRRGDVVVFRSDVFSRSSPGALPEVLVKRVIGLPGDAVAMQAGAPVVNGWPVPSCDAGAYLSVLPGGEAVVQGRLRVEFIEDRAYLIVRMPEGDSMEPYEVPPGEVFVLGDNRNGSFDSRAYNGGRGGGVPLDVINARVLGFLQGTHRDGTADFTRLLSGGVDSPQVHLDGVDSAALRAGIDRCLKARPRDAYPPKRPQG